MNELPLSSKWSREGKGASERWTACELQDGYTESWTMRISDFLGARRESEWAVNRVSVWIMSLELCGAASFSGKVGCSTSWEGERVSWSTAVSSATELIQQVASYVYAIAVRITVVWHVYSLQLAGSSSGESVNEFMETMTRNSRVSKKNLEFWTIDSWIAHH